jgi:hypothetical protein
MLLMTVRLLSIETRFPTQSGAVISAALGFIRKQGLFPCHKPAYASAAWKLIPPPPPPHATL